jgi:predicted MFS family arabinose efflux permease
MLMHTRTQRADVRGGSFGRSILEGLRYVRGNRLIFGLLALESSIGVFAVTTSLIAVFARDVYVIGPQGYGFLLSALGIGGVMGAGLLLLLGDMPNKARWILAGSVLHPVGLVVFALTANPVQGMMALTFVGTVEMVTGATRNTALHLWVEDRFRGRVMGLHGMGSRGLHPLGHLQAGALASLVGAPGAVFIGAALAVAGAVLVALKVPELRARGEPKVAAASTVLDRAVPLAVAAGGKVPPVL